VLPNVKISTRPRFNEALIPDEVKKFAHVQTAEGVLNVSLKEDPTDEQVAAVAKLPRLHSLTFFGQDKLTDAGVAHLKNAQTLHLDGNDRLTDAGVAHLAGLMELEHLSLNRVKLSDAGLEQLRGLVKLSSLNISGDRITDAGFAHLAGMTKLQHLGMIEMPN